MADSLRSVYKFEIILIDRPKRMEYASLVDVITFPKFGRHQKSLNVWCIVTHARHCAFLFLIEILGTFFRMFWNVFLSTNL
jgi:hypothetical protein